MTKEIGNYILPIKKLVDFESQPFKVLDDEAMYELAESIKTVGVLVPITVRPMNDDMYEIISGHRRKRACEIAGIDKVPAIIKELSDTEAAIMLVDSNLQRERILPSERAYAYRLKFEALKHQGRPSGHDVPNLLTTDVLGMVDNKTGRQVRRYIRLTELIDPLLQKVDDGSIPITVGTELSYLNVKWQSEVNDILESELCPVSVRQALKLKTHYFDDTLSRNVIMDLLSERKETPKGLQLDCERLKRYFPKEYTLKQCEELIWAILEEWKRKN